MKNTMQLMAIACVLMFTASLYYSPVQACPTHDGTACPLHQKQQKRMNRLAKQLDLTEKQKQQVNQIMQNFHQQQQKIHEKQQTKLEQRLSKVLTGQQMDKFKQLKQQRMEKKKQSMMEKHAEKT